MGEPKKVEMVFASELSLVGMVLAISFAILLLTGLALYVSFRVRETLREEHGRAASVVKVAFLIGLLFLSGGIFYFFSSGMTARSGPTVPSSATTDSIKTTTSITYSTSTSSLATTSTTSSATTSTSSLATSTTSSATTSTITSSDSSSSSTATSTTTSAAQGGLSLVSSFPTSEKTNSTFYGSFVIVNNSTSTASYVTLQVGNLFSQFTYQSCEISYNGGSSQDCTTMVGATSISVGNVPAGTAAITLGLEAPSQAGQYSYTVTLYYYIGSESSESTTLTIHVTA